MLNGHMKRKVWVSDNSGVAKLSRHHLETFTFKTLSNAPGNRVLQASACAALDFL